MKSEKPVSWVVVGATLLSATVLIHARGDPVRQFDGHSAALRKPGTLVRVDLIGDSTQADQAGYGCGFCENLTDQVDCVNMTQGGAGTSTY